MFPGPGFGLSTVNLGISLILFCWVCAYASVQIVEFIVYINLSILIPGAQFNTRNDEAKSCVSNSGPLLAYNRHEYMRLIRESAFLCTPIRLRAKSRSCYGFWAFPGAGRFFLFLASFTEQMTWNNTIRVIDKVTCYVYQTSTDHRNSHYRRAHGMSPNPCTNLFADCACRTDELFLLTVEIARSRESWPARK